MGKIIQFPADARSKLGFERVKSTYSVRDIGKQFGLSERHVRRWTQEGLIPVAPSSDEESPRYDFHALKQFRRVRELRSRGLSLKQIESELQGQLNLFSAPGGQLIQLPAKRTSFEEALLLHESGDKDAQEWYRKAIREEDFVEDAYCNLGILEFESGNVPAAFDCFGNSLKQDPRHFESHFNLAYLYFESGDLRLSRLHYEIAAEIEPCFPNLYFNLGLVHAMAEDYADAVSALEQVRRLAPEDEGLVVDELIARIRKVMTAAADQRPSGSR